MWRHLTEGGKKKELIQATLVADGDHQTKDKEPYINTTVRAVRYWSHCAGIGRNKSLLAVHSEDHTAREARYTEQEGGQSRMSRAGLD